MVSSARTASSLLSDEASWEVPFIYGTAWKKEKSKLLVKTAIAKGFRKVDTAAQPKHYQEPLVGEALRESFASGILKREELYLQTKYTTTAGQDLNNMPYDPSAPLEAQIHASVASSLDNLRPKGESKEESYIDCLLLHSPLPTIEQTLQAWRILESYVPHKIKALGISNTTLQVLQTIHENATIKPAVVQNRFYQQTRYDVPLRSFCNENGITYQSFWTLTGNPRLLGSGPIKTLSGSTGVSDSVALYALVVDQGIVVLNGTTSAVHMEEDLSGIRRVREWAKAHENEWSQISHGFRNSIDSQGL
ncbi:uncharacterized protein N0V89_009039 [Didymosphaeria variabile]|uniref:NADP-dependent oxidoreductase domain-containing protein n=1 Tax=Didymosphaeria variabile TaxID=1932322 RepID=A0A9W8XHD9_9PLEO|nr:uncharacterized protein N0V89_009039 [Didymosphaeria variabile]KAJ4350418.1 hypothetical protein N0V89_009039 [Didymosphaeria variabile]